MTDLVTTHALTKRFGGGTAPAVVEDLDLRIPAGCVYGFLGPNGSGKTTTMKMLLSLLTPTSGEIHVLGRPMTRTTRGELLPHIGSLIESPPGYGHLTGAENLRLVQRLLHLDDAQIARAVATVRLQDQLDKRVGAYSLGMKQRLGIAMALAREPRLLILDEPTNGLDPAGIEEFRDLLRYLADEGVTILVSSHLLGEIDRTATMLGILDRGRLLFQGSRAELAATCAPDVVIETSRPECAAQVLRSSGADIPDRRESSGDERRELRLAGLDDAGTARSVAALVGAGIDVYGVRREEQRLEDLFMDLTGGAR